MSISLRGSRVLITGGAGAIGSNLCDLVVQAGAREIVVLDNFVRGRRDNLAWAEANGPVQVVEGDICDRALVDEVTAGIDLVFHQAAIRITQCAEEPRLAKDVLVDGTFNVLEAAVNARRAQGRRRFVGVGLRPGRDVPDRRVAPPVRERTLYGAAKVFNEGLLRSFHGCTASTTSRCATSTSTARGWTSTACTPRCSSAGWSASQSGTPPLIIGDGTQTMDFVHVDDIARANLLAAKSDVTDGVYNIASGDRDDPARAGRDAAQGHGLRPSASSSAPPRKVNTVPRRLADIDRRRSATSASPPRLDLEAGVRGLVEWWRAERGPSLAAASRRRSRSPSRT